MAIKRIKTGTRRRKAATADVLGSAPRIQPPPTKWRKHYGRLTRARDFIQHRKDALTREAHEEQPGFSVHMADAATDSFDRDLALSRLSSEQDATYEIDDAINRIFDGTYGICELTGKPIDRERLEAIPWTRFSLEAERQLESDGAIRRTRLAPREPVVRTTGEESESQGSSE